MRVLLPLPVTISTSPSPGSGTSRRFRPSASEIRRPEPYSSAITAASRAQIQGSRFSPARRRHRSDAWPRAIWIGFGRLLPILGARIADSAPTLPLPSRSRKRPNERNPASARISERPPISSARRIAMKARTSLASSAAKRCKRHRAPQCSPEKDQKLPQVARIGLEGLRRQPPLGAQMRQPARHLRAISRRRRRRARLACMAVAGFAMVSCSGRDRSH